MFTPNELVFTFGSFYVSVNFGENPSRNANVRVHTDGYTDRGKLDFSERERPLGLYVIARPSVVCLSVCLSSMTFVCPTQPVKISGNVSRPFGTLAII